MSAKKPFENTGAGPASQPRPDPKAEGRKWPLGAAVLIVIVSGILCWAAILFFVYLVAF